jgi:plasmid maintenance system antidote protein VapI
MEYTFDIVGVSPVLYFFDHQQQNMQKHQPQRVEYLGTQTCTLDAFLESVESVPATECWNLDQVVDTVIEFWLNNAESIQYWKTRLQDAGRDNLLVARVADMKALQAEFESLLGKNW